MIEKVFNCGIDELDQYPRQFTIPNDKKNIGKTFLATLGSKPDKPIGYYTESMAQILFTDLPDSIKKRIPKYPVPFMRIGKLAIGSYFKGINIDSFLLKDALIRAVNISSEVALNCVIVDALNEAAKSFYLKVGFVAFKDNPLTLEIHLKTIKDTL